MDNNIIKTKINNSIDRIYKQDGDLFLRNNYEVTISSKLAQYLFKEFSKHDVDCEYNKHGTIKKEAMINSKLKEIRPDILIHKRGGDKKNLVAIEIKKEQNSENRDYDFSKLKVLTSENGNFHYQLGIFIDFTQSYAQRRILYFENGGETQ